MNIAIVAETAPAKTMLPIIEKMDANILSLTHSDMAWSLLEPYSLEIHSIGESRRKSANKNSTFKIGRLVVQDSYNVYSCLKDHDMDVVMTCGNAGDVRKGISGAKKLNIPKLHIEQDIYNPIEMIAYADVITVPNNEYKKKLKKMYDIDNTINIKGYPQAEYVMNQPLGDVDEIHNYYGTDDFYILFLGGDTKPDDIPVLIGEAEKLNKDILIIPYRFNVDYVCQFISRKGVYVIDGSVNLINLMNASQGIIFCSGMGVTIEAGALSVPAVKIKGFHTEHASNDLARSIGIDVVSAYDMNDSVERMKPPHGSQLIKNGCTASLKVAEILENMDMFSSKCGGLGSLRKIWNQRKQYR